MLASRAGWACWRRQPRRLAAAGKSAAIQMLSDHQGSCPAQGYASRRRAAATPEVAYPGKDGGCPARAARVCRRRHSDDGPTPCLYGVYTVDGHAAEWGAIVAPGRDAHPNDVPPATFLGLSLLGLETGQRGPLLRADGSVGEVLLVRVQPAEALEVDGTPVVSRKGRRR